MRRLLGILHDGALHLIATVTALSPALYAAVIAIILAVALSRDFYVMEVLVLVIIYAQFAASWDILSGYTEQDNFGHAFFIGGAGYIAAMLSKWLHLTPWLGVPIAAAAVAFVGMGVGWLTLRLRGPYFALSTIAFAAVLFKLTYIFSTITGGEEGISGIASFTRDVDTDLYACLALFVVSVICLTAFARSHYGLVLRSTQHNEDAAQASGINTAYYKVAAFVVSAFFAGVGGGTYAHTQLHVGPELLAGSLSVLVVLLATIGGRGTIVGPAIAAGLLTILDAWLRIVENYRPALFTAMLILLVYIFPSGVVRARLVSDSRVLRRLLLGRKT